MIFTVLHVTASSTLATAAAPMRTRPLAESLRLPPNARAMGCSPAGVMADAAACSIVPDRATGSPYDSLVVRIDSGLADGWCDDPRDRRLQQAGESALSGAAPRRFGASDGLYDLIRRPRLTTTPRWFAGPDRRSSCMSLPQDYPPTEGCVALGRRGSGGVCWRRRRPWRRAWRSASIPKPGARRGRSARRTAPSRCVRWSHRRRSPSRNRRSFPSTAPRHAVAAGDQGKQGEVGTRTARRSGECTSVPRSPRPCASAARHR